MMSCLLVSLEQVVTQAAAIKDMKIYAGDIFTTAGQTHVMMVRRYSGPTEPVELVEGNSNINSGGDEVTRRRDKNYWGPTIGNKFDRKNIGAVVQIIKCPKGDPSSAKMKRMLGSQTDNGGKMVLTKRIADLLSEKPYLRPATDDLSIASDAA